MTAEDENAFDVAILLAGDVQTPGVFRLHEEKSGEDMCHLSLEIDGARWDGSGTDYFDAFCEIRGQLERIGAFPLCRGAALDVYPSPACRDMGGGLTAYRMQLGQRALQKDFGSIFTAEPQLRPATVREQEEFIEAWRKSLDKRP